MYDRSKDDQMSVSDALSGTYSAEWQTAIEQELLVIKKMGTWKPEFLPRDKKTVNTREVFSRKTDSTWNVSRYRDRLVAKGFSNTEVNDYEEVSAPVANYTSLRYLISLKVLKQYDISQLDVKNGFLKGTLSEDIYLEVPHCV